jgi:peptidoglycan/xylan/chitin deacetylase (PgdA/CDA1 family)
MQMNKSIKPVIIPDHIPMLRADRLLSIYFIRPLLNVLNFRAFNVPILMYHSVSDDPENGVSAYYRVTTSPARFREQMEWLHSSGYSVADLGQAIHGLKDGNTVKTRPVVLTFDDGFRDFLQHAWPVLQEFGYPATVYLATDYIRKNPTLFKNRECLTWSEIRGLHDNGIVFGSHTHSHPTLHDLSWKEISRELQESREKIESELQSSVSRFSYPYAFPQEDPAFVDSFQKELRDQGYTTAVTTIIGGAQKETDPLCLPRLPINDEDDEKLFKAKLYGAYDWVSVPQKGLRRIKSMVSHKSPGHSPLIII